MTSTSFTITCAKKLNIILSMRTNAITLQNREKLKTPFILFEVLDAMNKEFIIQGCIYANSY